MTIKLRSKRGEGVNWEKRKGRKSSDLGTSEENRMEGTIVILDASVSQIELLVQFNFYLHWHHRLFEFQ